MQARGTLALLAAVIAAAVALWMEMSGDSGPHAPIEDGSPRRIETPATPLLGMDLGGIEAIVLRDERGEIEQRRPAGGWSSSVADQAVVEFLGNLKNLGRVQEIEVTGSGLAQYGLADALHRIELHRGSEAIRIDIGTRNPSGTGVYARIAGEEKIILAGALLDWEFDKLANKLRSEP